MNVSDAAGERRGRPEVLAGHVLAPARALDLAGLAGLLCFSAGVTRFLQDVLFRAAPRPARCTDGGGRGLRPPWRPARRVDHFEPAELVLRRLQDGDFRARLAASAAEPAIAWRRCAWWSPGSLADDLEVRPARLASPVLDAGAIVANLLAVAAAAGWGARVLLGFVDQEVAGLVGIGGPEEYPLCVGGR